MEMTFVEEHQQQCLWMLATDLAKAVFRVAARVVDMVQRLPFIRSTPKMLETQTLPA